MQNCKCNAALKEGSRQMANWKKVHNSKFIPFLYPRRFFFLKEGRNRNCPKERVFLLVEMKSYKMAFSLTWHRSDNPLKGGFISPVSKHWYIFSRKKQYRALSN